MTKMYNEMQEGFKKVDEEFKKVDEKFKKVDEEFKKVHNDIAKIQVTIENEIKPDIKASLEGYSHIYNKLENIEKEVSKHDEIILRRVR